MYFHNLTRHVNTVAYSALPDIVAYFEYYFWGFFQYTDMFRCIYNYKSITLNTHICVFKSKPTKQKMKQRQKSTTAGFSSFKLEFV